MSFRPTKEDQRSLDQFVGTVLDAYKSGRADRDACIGAIAHATTAAAIENVPEFRAYVRLSEDQLFDFGESIADDQRPHNSE